MIYWKRNSDDTLFNKDLAIQSELQHINFSNKVKNASTFAVTMFSPQRLKTGAMTIQPHSANSVALTV